MNFDKDLYDVAVVGGGPAGLTAALYLARAQYRVVVIESEGFGGQITITSEVVNYPGVAHTDGKALTETMRKQAESFGAEFLLAKADSIDAHGDIKLVHTSRGDVRCFGILLATGAHPRMVGFEGENQFRGRGVAYCATCDGEFFTDRDVYVVGGGFAAAEESIFLTRYASHVTVLIRGDDFTCAKSVSDPVYQNEKITVVTNTTVESVSGDTFVEKLTCRNTQTGDITEYKAADGGSIGVFVFAGYTPATDLVKGIADLNEQGYVITDRSQQTSVSGLYAAGDVCVKSLRQVVTAVGDGALAATELERYAAEMQRKTGVCPKLPDTPKPTDKPADTPAESSSQQSLFSADMLAQLNAVFARMEQPLVLSVYTDERPVSAELVQYMESLAALTDKLTVETHEHSGEKELPCVKVCRSDGSESGLAFHGVPGGHEFTSFVLGLYNVSGPGQALDESTVSRIRAIDKPTKIMLLVSLSCTMCPELVTAAQRVASLSDYVTADVYDINHFAKLKDKYRVMSVPCMVTDDTQVTFGKKNISQLLDLLGV